MKCVAEQQLLQHVWLQRTAPVHPGMQCLVGGNMLYSSVTSAVEMLQSARVAPAAGVSVSGLKCAATKPQAAGHRVPQAVACRLSASQQMRHAVVCYDPAGGSSVWMSWSFCAGVVRFWGRQLLVAVFTFE
jgi:hypothetical protein